MRVRFEFTIDDLIDVGERTLSASSVVRRMRRSSAAAMAILGGLLFFAFAPVAGPARLAGAAAAAAVSALAYPALRNATVKRRLRDFWRERLAGGGPFVCEVELSESGVTTRQFDTEASTPWSAVRSVVETADSVDLTFDTGLIVVRDRAFSSPAEKHEFAELGRRHLGGS